MSMQPHVGLSSAKTEALLRCFLWFAEDGCLNILVVLSSYRWLRRKYLRMELLK